MLDQWLQRIHPEDRDKVKLASDRTFLKKWIATLNSES